MIDYIANNCTGQRLIGIELGVFHGHNALTILRNVPVKTLILIEKNPLYRPIIECNLKKYKNKYILRIGDSKNVIKELSTNMVDFVYIDGSHNYADVMLDIINYFPIVKRYGIIGGHDFKASCDVSFAVMDFIRKNNLNLFGFDQDWWIIKE
jgi:predicted O-methyltransferase YrrM